VKRLIPKKSSSLSLSSAYGFFIVISLLAQLAENQIFSDDFKRVTTFSSAFAG
jgi:hypothetical protein